MKITPRLALLVFLGGALGTLARYELDELLTYFWLLLSVNVLGTFVLGMAYGDSKGGNETRAFFGIGFAGGFTTMSGVSLLTLTALPALPVLIIYLFVMFALALIAYRLGFRLLNGGTK